MRYNEIVAISEHELQKFLMSGSACMWRYLIILSLRHHPIILMLLLATPEQRRAMTRAAWRERADMSLASNPRFVLKKPTAVLRVLDTMVGVMYFHPPARVMTQASTAEVSAQWDLMWRT